MRIILRLALLMLIASSAVPASAQIVINELLPDPTGPGGTGDANNDGVVSATQDEFVEIVNDSGGPIDLTGWTLETSGGSIRHAFASATVLADQNAIVVFGGGTPTGSFGGAQVVTASSGSVGLTNVGTTVILRDDLAVIRDDLPYSSPVPNGSSLNRDPDVSGPSFTDHVLVSGSGGALFSPGARVDGLAFDPTPVPALSLIGRGLLALALWMTTFGVRAMRSSGTRRSRIRRLLPGEESGLVP